uniref:Large ribosomal subunit protein bL9m n=1 Tax=Panagrellus redivivus TaxID=6233 RepID=A0A7E4VWJ3_PANRE
MMASSRVNLLKAALGTFPAKFCGQSTRNTYVFQHVVVPPATPPGQTQRPPTEKQDFQKYELIEEETTTPAGPISVILLEDVEGVGHQFDVVEVDREIARNDLLLTRKAQYASPFDLKYYGDLKERMKDELAKRVRIPFEWLQIGRRLQKMVVPLTVSMDDAWTLNKGIVVASLRQIGVDVLDGAVHLPVEAISGPNFELEARLIRFYIVINKQYVIPMIGRLSHISADESKQALYPDTDKAITSEQLRKFGLVPETPYFHKSADIDDNFGVFDFMKARAKKV